MRTGERVESVLILCAGKGTRMGPVGESLPKALWPIFDKTLLQLQVSYAKKNFPDAAIYLNSYYFNRELKSYVDQHFKENEVTLIIEDRPLDIGGAVYNFANKISYQGLGVILNCDQFIFLDSEKWQEITELSSQSSGVLLTKDVHISEGYNAVCFDEDGLFTKVTCVDELKKMQLESYQTYLGVCMLNFSKLPRREVQNIKFFDAVVNPSQGCFGYKNIVQHFHLNHEAYVDVGTLTLYMQVIKRLLDEVFASVSIKGLIHHEKEMSPFLKFLALEKSFNVHAFDCQSGSYGSTLSQVSHFMSGHFTLDFKDLSVRLY